MSNLKTCTSCKRALQLEDFGRREASIDGLAPICNECNKIKCLAYHAAHRDEANAKNRAYYAKNKDQIRLSSKKYREDNKEKIKQQREPYLLAHRDDKAEYDRAYNAARAEDNVRRVQEWRKANPDARIAQKGKRRAQKRGSKAERLPRNYRQRLYDAQHGMCYYCGGILE
jgi:hypothetical protein